MEERSKDPPTCVKFVVTYKVGVIAFQRIQDERFVCFRDLEIGEAATIGEVELCHNGLHTQTRQFRVHLDIHRFVRLYPDNEFIPWDILEYAGRDVLELYSDFRLLLVECYETSVVLFCGPCWVSHAFTSFKYEGYAIPPLVLDVRNHGAKCGTP